MEKHIINLFEIENLSDLELRYKLYEIDNLPKDTNYNKNINILRKNLSYELWRPVALIKKDGKHYVAIPSDSKDPVLEQHLVPHIINLIPENQEYKLKLSEFTQDNFQIVTSFLKFYINTPLMNDHKNIWRQSSQKFYEKSPINQYDKQRKIDVHEGFRFRVVPYQDKIYLAIDVTYKYLDSNFITDYVTPDKIEPYLRKHFMYLFGDRWYQIQLWNVTGKSISEQKFTKKTGETFFVYDYTKSECEKSNTSYITNLDPNAPAIVYRYPGKKDDMYGSLSLCKRTYKTNEMTDRKLHSLSIKNPEERFKIITQEIIPGYFSNIFINDKQVRISRNPLEVDKKTFEVPKLIFGNDSILKVGNNSGEVNLDKLGKERIKCLYDREKGLYKDDPFDLQYFVVPESLPRAISEYFYLELCNLIEKFSNNSYKPEIVTYDDRGKYTLLKQRDAITKRFEYLQINRGCALLVLPSNSRDKLHDYIKKKLIEEFEVKCQCAMASKIQSFFYKKTVKGEDTYSIRYEKESRFSSYVKHAALGLIIINNNWPWMIGNDLNCDVHIGLDVLNNCAGFTFFYNNPKLCYFHWSKSKQAEKLPANQIKSVIYEKLKDDLTTHNIEPNAIILHRDGRSFPEEHKGFHQAIEQLEREGIITTNTHTAIVDVHKTSFKSLRLAEKDYNDKLKNPIIGAYFVLNDNEGMILNTGIPFISQGTANPLDINIADGDINIEPILEDIFSLSQLVWSAPDKCSRIPITIKLSDEFLKPLATVTDEEDIYSEESSEDDKDYKELVV